MAIQAQFMYNFLMVIHWNIRKRDLAYKFSNQPGDWLKSVEVKHVPEFLKGQLSHM